MMFSRLFLALLYSTSALAKLTNYTIDDTSPLVAYNGPIILQCHPGTCAQGWTNQTFNSTSTITSDSITVSFTGSSVYVFLDATSDVLFTLDNSQDVAFWTPPPPPNGTIHLAYHSTSLSPTPHTLVIAPSAPDGIIDLDYILYTVDVKHTPHRHHRWECSRRSGSSPRSPRTHRLPRSAAELEAEEVERAVVASGVEGELSLRAGGRSARR
ncbi:hypothetical protein MSAN_01148100 [Mycena sanguinolenta]|uniref:Uncharacterized protein n=1 Tax=Mycena sanguinolenta TaxID=230812 RepID=A0A8H6YJT7_9AGAR|nr:hypothetical protein MSAN_01148100 [Mycena sanguinolenta]